MMHTRGFTLIETLVAVTLLATTIVLPYYAIQRSLIATYTARDELIASSLAQEAIEYVRAVRDSNYLYSAATSNTSRSWLYGVDGTNAGPNCKTYRCTLDPTSSTPIRACFTNTACSAKLYLSTTNLYNQSSSGTQTRFTRTFQLSCVDGTTTCNLQNAREVRVTATVTWNYHGAQSVVVSDVLSNWL